MPGRPPIRAGTVRGPRKHLRYPEQFGMLDDPQFKPGTNVHVRAAVLTQHRLAQRVFDVMTREEMSFKEIADEIGVSVEQVQRLLRGESAATLERMHQLAAVIGYDLGVSFRASKRNA